MNTEKTYISHGLVMTYVRTYVRAPGTPVPRQKKSQAYQSICFVKKSKIAMFLDGWMVLFGIWIIIALDCTVTYFVSVKEWFIFDLFIGQDYLLLMLVYMQ